MNEVISTLLTSIITAVVPILSACVIVYIKTWRDKTVAETDNTKHQQYITEIADAVSAAVTATSQTYVDALKKNGEFTAEAQQEALKKGSRRLRGIYQSCGTDIYYRHLRRPYRVSAQSH